MNMQKLHCRKIYLTVQRIKEALFSGLIFGIMVGFIFGSLATIRSTSDGLWIGLSFGGVFGLFVSILFFGLGSERFPEELYIKCKIQRVVSDDEYDVVIIENSGELKLESVHKSALINEDTETYVKAEKCKGKICVWAGNIYSNPRPITIKPLDSNIVTI